MLELKIHTDRAQPRQETDATGMGEHFAAPANLSSCPPDRLAEGAVAGVPPANEGQPDHDRATVWIKAVKGTYPGNFCWGVVVRLDTAGNPAAGLLRGGWDVAGCTTAEAELAGVESALKTLRASYPTVRCVEIRTASPWVANRIKDDLPGWGLEIPRSKGGNIVNCRGDWRRVAEAAQGFALTAHLTPKGTDEGDNVTLDEAQAWAKGQRWKEDRRMTSAKRQEVAAINQAALSKRGKNGAKARARNADQRAKAGRAAAARDNR